MCVLHYIVRLPLVSYFTVPLHQSRMSRSRVAFQNFSAHTATKIATVLLVYTNIKHTINSSGGGGV